MQVLKGACLNCLFQRLLFPISQLQGQDQQNGKQT